MAGTKTDLSLPEPWQLLVEVEFDDLQIPITGTLDEIVRDHAKGAFVLGHHFRRDPHSGKWGPCLRCGAILEDGSLTIPDMLPCERSAVAG